MPKYGFTTDDTGTAVCAVKDWPQISAGYLLFCYGTVPDPNSVCPDSHQKCLRKAESILQTSLTQIAQTTGHIDHAYAATIICDGIRKANAQVHEIAAYLGQSICIGGVVAFFYKEEYVLVPFGGGSICAWDGIKLTRIGDPILNEYVTINPIGSNSTWTGKYWSGTLQDNTRLLLTSIPLREDPETVECISKGSTNSSNDHTTALLLRQLLLKRDLPPVAVLDFHN